MALIAACVERGDDIHLERGSSVVECRTSNQVSPGSNTRRVNLRPKST